MKKECLVCKTEFKTYPSKIKLGRGKYCSRKCSDSVTLIKIGQHLSITTQIKKGERLPEHIRVGQLGKKPSNDKGITDAGLDYRRVGKNLKEHRVVVEKYLGRKLLKEEVVHHINENKSDNRIENLWVFANSGSHTRHHRGCEYPENDVVFKGGVAFCP